jgi:hypothetical protein
MEGIDVNIWSVILRVREQWNRVDLLMKLDTNEVKAIKNVFTVPLDTGVGHEHCSARSDT